MSNDASYPVHTRSGRELTEDDVEQLADDFEHEDADEDPRVLGRLGNRPRGRPSLTGRAASSPRVSFRTTDDLRALAEQRAAREGKTVSQVAREALEHHLDAV